METMTYGTGEPVMIGDRVRVRKRLGRELHGTVAWVYDATKPSPPNGPNEYGFGVRLDNGSDIYVGNQPKDVSLSSRKNA
jgi:hypothetical protein